jgi:2,4-dienoyl-CoA reductase-like NADH-dependent reductase (Old Yellow Enzyme family)
VKISATDWLDVGWDLEQSVEYSKELKRRGADWVTASSGGISPLQKIAVTFSPLLLPTRARGADDGGRRRRDASYGVARDSHPVSTIR